MTDESGKSIRISLAGKPTEKCWKTPEEAPAEITKVHPCFNEIAREQVAHNACGDVDYV